MPDIHVQICRSLDYLHPAWRARFRKLQERLIVGHSKGETKTLFQVFETFRSPQRQDYLLRQGNGVTKAGAWQSAHNYGCACDFVPNENGWSWNDDHDWLYLRDRAVECDLVAPFSWDKAHVQVPGWRHALAFKLEHMTGV